MKTFQYVLSAAFVAGLMTFGASGTALAGEDCFGGHTTKSVDSGQSAPADNSIADGSAGQTPVPSQGG